MRDPENPPRSKTTVSRWGSDGRYEGHRGGIKYLAESTRIVRHRPPPRYGGSRIAARDLGCAKVNLQVRRSNEAATEFHQRIGYAIDDVISLGKRLE